MKHIALADIASKRSYVGADTIHVNEPSHNRPQIPAALIGNTIVTIIDTTAAVLTIRLGHNASTLRKIMSAHLKAFSGL